MIEWIEIDKENLPKKSVLACCIQKNIDGKDEWTYDVGTLIARYEGKRVDCLGRGTSELRDVTHYAHINNPKTIQ